MASRKGVIFISDHYMVTAIREKKGAIRLYDKEIIKDKFSKLYIFSNFLSSIPFVRGLWSVYIVFLANWKLLFVLFWISILGAISMNMVLNNGCDEDIPGFLWLLVFILFIFLLKGTSWGKYHAAEHQVANMYQQEKSIDLHKARLASRVHRNCGTNLVVFATTITIVMYMLFDINVLLAGLIGISVGTEIHFNEHKIARKMLLPFYVVGGVLQLLAFTSKAQDCHLEVAIASLNELIIKEKRVGS